jgi:hypothetical protein
VQYLEEETQGSKGRRGGGGARKVTPQRKQNNRKAQQRYREKRKAQAAEREQQVAMLSSQLAAMQNIQNEHAAVSTENVHLREILDQKEQEIEELKVCSHFPPECTSPALPFLCIFLRSSQYSDSTFLHTS